MTHAEILKKTISTLEEQLGIDSSEITEDSKIVDDLGADSLDIVELIMAMEEEFEIEVPDEEAETIVTVRDAVKLAYEALRAKRMITG